MVQKIEDYPKRGSTIKADLQNLTLAFHQTVYETNLFDHQIGHAHKASVSKSSPPADNRVVSVTH